jgi:hypothetical protein
LFPFLLLVPMLVMLAGWLEDMARVMDARGKAVAAADAASLAGALTAEAVPQTEVELERDGNGNVVGAREKVVGCRAVIPDSEAAGAANATLLMNPAPAGGAWDDFAGWKTGEDRFAYRVRGMVGLPWWGAAKLMLGAGREHSRMRVGFEAEARAYCVLPEGGGESGEGG